MRLTPVTVLLVFVLGSAGCREQSGKDTPMAPSFRATSSIREIMQSVVAPSAQGLWDAVGTVSNAQGTVDLAPKTNEDWTALRRHAVTLVESTNLLQIPGRHIAPAGAETLKADDAEPGAELHPDEIERRVAANWPAWTAMALALHGAATNMLDTIDRKDVAALERTGSELDGICENCHLAFWYPPKQAK